MQDSGVPPLSSTATIICTVEDENDHAPELAVLSHDIEILENQDPGVVYTVLAFDTDAGDNGVVTYRIAGESHKVGTLWELTKADGLEIFLFWCLLSFPANSTPSENCCSLPVRVQP